MITTQIIGTPVNSNWEAKLVEVIDYIEVGAFVKIVGNKATLASAGDTIFGVASLEGTTSPNGGKLQQIIIEGEVYCKEDPSTFVGVETGGTSQVLTTDINGVNIATSPISGYIAKI
jgi:hypothetical protein